MNIAVFGGAFNPVHIGHIALCKAFDDELHFDKILFVPSKVSPHKSSENLIDEKYRVDMLKIAVKDIKNAAVSDIELNRFGKSYTVDTLKQLKTENTGDTLYLICGSDMFLTLHDWREPVEIFKNAVICAARRGEENEEIIEQQSNMLKKLGAEILLTDSFIPPVSSTIIRDMVSNGLDCKNMLPCGVYDYIIKNKLYNKKA